jgi:hypothetical protein
MAMNSRSGFQFSVFLSLIRALFPHWNFFDRVAHQFEVRYQTEEIPSWTLISFDQKPGFFSLFFNPSVNQALAEIGIIEHFAREIQEIGTEAEADRIQGLSTFRMLKSLLRVKLADVGPVPSSLKFQIVARSPKETIEIYTSEWVTPEGP